MIYYWFVDCCRLSIDSVYSYRIQIHRGKSDGNLRGCGRVNLLLAPQSAQLGAALGLGLAARANSGLSRRPGIRRPGLRQNNARIMVSRSEMECAHTPLRLCLFVSLSLFISLYLSLSIYLSIYLYLYISLALLLNCLLWSQCNPSVNLCLIYAGKERDDFLCTPKLRILGESVSFNIRGGKSW